MLNFLVECDEFEVFKSKPYWILALCCSCALLFTSFLVWFGCVVNFEVKLEMVRVEGEGEQEKKKEAAKK